MGALLQAIAELQPTRRKTRIVAIDGCGGSGKTTLANGVAARLKNATIVRTDDFSGPDVTEWDWRRMKTQVLDFIAEDRPGRYQRHDWPTDRLAEWHSVPVGGVLIVEGVSSMRAELGRYWDLAIWVACSPERRLARGIARDGESRRSQWADVWMPQEDEYVNRERPDRRADFIVNGEEPVAL